MRSIPHWTAEHSPALSLDILRDLALTHTPHAGRHREPLERLLLKADYKGLCEYELNYSEDGLTAHAVMHIRQVLAFFSKLKHLEIGIDREAKAVQKFLEAEARCKEQNQFFRDYRNGLICIDKDVSRVFHSARRKVHNVLGEAPTIEQLLLRFGPGATRGVKRKDASPRAKLRESIQCSEGLFPYVKSMLATMPALSDQLLDESFVELFEDGSGYEVTSRWTVQIVDAKLTFQPKNASNLRGAMTEPGFNVLAQLALGDEMARRMREHGIDIRDQTLNQRRCRNGSMRVTSPEEELLREATVDLVSASDLISIEGVAEVSSLEWFTLFKAFRSGSAILPDGSTIEMEKMSSMGNGFTFPLETLIFWALASSCCHDDNECSVYGDDIIVPKYAIPLLYQVLHVFGLEVNKKKSFIDGPFRESCGRDYFNGIDVRPYYQKEWVSARTLFILHNFYIRQGDEDRAAIVREFIHPDLRRFGPDGYGDGHLLGDHPHKRKPRHVRHGYSGYIFSTFTLRPRREIRPLPGDYVLPLYTIYRRGVSQETLPFPISRSNVRFLENRTCSHLTADDISYEQSRNLVRDSFSFILEPLPEVIVDGEVCKHLTVPGDDGYKCIDIYTLG